MQPCLSGMATLVGVELISILFLWAGHEQRTILLLLYNQRRNPSCLKSSLRPRCFFRGSLFLFSFCVLPAAALSRPTRVLVEARCARSCPSITGSLFHRVVAPGLCACMRFLFFYVW